MSGVRNRPRGARFAFFGLGLCAFALTPTEVGYQDIASLLARQPGVAERWQKRVFSAVSTIQVATYSFGRPIGTSLPQAGLSISWRAIDNPSVGNSDPRHHRLDQPQPDGRRPVPRYQAVRFPQGRSHPEGRSPGRTTPPPETSDARGQHAQASKIPSTSNASVRGAKTAEVGAGIADHAGRSIRNFRRR